MIHSLQASQSLAAAAAYVAAVHAAAATLLLLLLLLLLLTAHAADDLLTSGAAALGSGSDWLGLARSLGSYGRSTNTRLACGRVDARASGRAGKRTSRRAGKRTRALSSEDEQRGRAARTSRVGMSSEGTSREDSSEDSMLRG